MSKKLATTDVLIAHYQRQGYQLAKDHYESHIIPFERGVNHLKALLDIIDAYALALPDTTLLDMLRKLNTTNIVSDGDIEKDLSGTWYSLNALAAGAGYNLRGEYADLCEQVDGVLRALTTALHTGNCEPLRESAHQRPDIGQLSAVRIGRDKGITAVTERLGFLGDRFRQEYSYLGWAAVANRVIEYLENIAGRDDTENEMLFELTSRPERSYQAKAQKTKTRGDYLKNLVSDWQKAKKKKTA